MASENSLQPAIPRFDGHYDHRSMLMENFLRSQGILELKALEDRSKDLKAKNYLFQAIDRSILETILKKDTAKDIWDSLKQKYQGTARVKRAQLQALRKEFEVLHMKTGESINDYFGRTLIIANKMRTHGERMGGRHGGRGAYRGRGRGNGRFGFDKSFLECYNCHELGHFQWECPKRARDPKVNYAETKEEMLLMAQVDFKEAGTEYIWFLDSGCSNHMCGRREIFIELDSNFRESVKLGNDSSLTVKGKGKVRMEVNGIVHVITGVYFVPDLKNNLLSIGQLQERGLAVLIQHGKCKIFHPEKGLIMETEMTCNRMFVLARPPKEQKCLSMMTTIKRIFGIVVMGTSVGMDSK
ncbi:hypothetical protein AAG906_009721 [Vitis piasezkii]